MATTTTTKTITGLRGWACQQSWHILKTWRKWPKKRPRNSNTSKSGQTGQKHVILDWLKQKNLYTIWIQSGINLFVCIMSKSPVSFGTLQSMFLKARSIEFLIHRNKKKIILMIHYSLILELCHLLPMPIQKIVFHLLESHN